MSPLAVLLRVKEKTLDEILAPYTYEREDDAQV